MWDRQCEMNRLQGYPDYHWMHCSHGSGKLVIQDNEYIISKGMGFLMAPYVPHKYTPVTDNWHTHWVTFSGGYVKELFEIIRLNDVEIFTSTDISQLNEILDKIYIAESSFDVSKVLTCSSLLYRFLTLIPSCTDRNRGTSTNMKLRQLHPVVAFIENHYGDAPTLEQMSEIIHVTPYHLCRLFKVAIGMSPFFYLTRYRIQKAKELILQAPASLLYDIATEVGYHDTSYFCAKFKEIEKLTPTEFKKLHS